MNSSDHCYEACKILMSIDAAQPLPSEWWQKNHFACSICRCDFMIMRAGGLFWIISAFNCQYNSGLNVVTFRELKVWLSVEHDRAVVREIFGGFRDCLLNGWSQTSASLSRTKLDQKWSNKASHHARHGTSQHEWKCLVFHFHGRSSCTL